LYEYASEQRDYSSCNIIQHFGLDSHPSCYEKPDQARPKPTFCQIPFMEKMKIAWMAASGATAKRFVFRGTVRFSI
jgi:hypothetical protein